MNTGFLFWLPMVTVGFRYLLLVRFASVCFGLVRVNGNGGRDRKGCEHFKEQLGVLPKAAHSAAA
jgi:hypothetical protein